MRLIIISPVSHAALKISSVPAYWNEVPENPELVLTNCPRFVEERRNLEKTLGEVLVPENLELRS